MKRLRQVITLRKTKKNEKTKTSYKLLTDLVQMRYKAKENISEYIMKMSNIASKLKALKLDLSSDLLVHLYSSLFLHNTVNL